MSDLFYTGKVEGLYTTPNNDTFVTESRDELLFSLDGIPNNRHFGYQRLSGGREKKFYPRGTLIRNNRQWSAVSVEELKQIADTMQLEEVKPEWIGANLLISGIPDLSLLPGLTRLTFRPGSADEVVLIVYGQNKPCIHAHHSIENAVSQTVKNPFTKAAANCRGLVGWVEKAGVVRVGDEVVAG
jgi:hypothetical protein